MRFSAITAAAVLAGSSQALPLSLTDLISAASADLTSLLSSLGASVVTSKTVSSTAGTKAPFVNKAYGSVATGAVSSTRYSPSINWPLGVNGGNFINWKTYKANGVNLGGWLEKEHGFDRPWWDAIDSTAGDEWTLCLNLGSKCAQVMEARYASFLNTTTIDQLASVGVNTLRIPTTYAAWIKYPGSKMYSGFQQTWLRAMTTYAITKYNMHVIIGLHSLPGGINSLDIGEAFGHDGWFYNTTNLNYSYQAVDQVLNFIKTSGYINAFTVAPINEASDNLAAFGSAAGLSTNAAAWIATYFNGVIAQVEKVDKRIPVMLQDCFQGAAYWAPLFDASKNIIFDTHTYILYIPGVNPSNALPTICGIAAGMGASQTKFPMYMGEYALEVNQNNSLDVATRKAIFDTQRYAWQKYFSGGSMWTAIAYNTDAVAGNGTRRDYWSYIDLIKAGVITKQTTASYCQ